MSRPAHLTLAGAVVALAATVGIAGCFGPRYVAQAAYGQFSMYRDARPIGDVIADTSTPDHVRRLLLEVDRIRAYGRAHGLASKGNYRTYVDLDRSAAVWFVAAAPRLSFEPKEWCFPIVGCFPMLGWFDLTEALRFRKELMRKGLDVYVRGAGAFSTAGWFRDPIVSSMLTEDDDAMGNLVNVLLHESVHANILIRDQANFNESLAAFIGDGLTSAFLTERFGPDSPELLAYEQGLEDGDDAYAKMLAAYDELEKLYASDAADAVKLAEKKKVYDRLESAVTFAHRPNNATLVGIRTYRLGKDEFELLFDTCGRDWRRFIASVKTIDASSFQEPTQEDMKPVILPLVRAGCSGGKK